MMNARAKNALVALFDKVAFSAQDVSAEIEELRTALFNLDEVVGISAVYTQGNTIVWSDGVTSIESLRSSLVVKAEYGDGTEVNVTNYTLSGTLTVGTSTIEVSYAGFTATFTVNVTQFGSKMSYQFTQGELIMLTGSPTGDTNKNRFIDTAVTKRITFGMNYGKKKYLNQNLNEIDIYPVPVPQNASRVTVSITPGTYSCAIQSAFLIDNAYYGQPDKSGGAAINPGWWQGSGTFDLSAIGSRSALYIIVNTKNASDTAFTNANKPTNLVVTFE